MSFFERLKTAASAEWRAYTEHHTVTSRFYDAASMGEDSGINDGFSNSL
jgi:hypothetical protein